MALLGRVTVAALLFCASCSPFLPPSQPAGVWQYFAMSVNDAPMVAQGARLQMVAANEERTVYTVTAGNVSERVMVVLSVHADGTATGADIVLFETGCIRFARTGGRSCR